MKNANIFVDVDLTLVDANGRIFPGAPEALRKLQSKGCHLFLWSTNGADYARKVAGLHGLSDVFEGFTAKPDVVIDDVPATALNPFVFGVTPDEPWPRLVDRIISRHID